MSPEQIAARNRSAQSIQSRTTIIAVIGLGYVGLPLAIRASSRGFSVIGYDIDEVKIAQLSGRDADFLEGEAARAFKTVRSLTVTSNEHDLARADVHIICVPTPVDHRRTPDLRPLESAAAAVGRALKRGALVIVESTVNPGACEEVVLPILERESGLDADQFLFAHCPERINPGDSDWNVSTIPRVIGGWNAESLDRAKTLYAQLVDAEIVTMANIKEAEAVKMVENSFRDINIAFVNELAMAFDKAGIDIVNVIRGASTKPFGFMPHYPGCGVGGHCIPVDPYYLIRFGHTNGFEHRFLKIARHINDSMPLYTVKLLQEALRVKRKNLKGSTVALLGLSYKKDIPDVRESPALTIRDLLEGRDVRVLSYDPYVRHDSTARSLEAALTEADAAIIATDHSAFSELQPENFAEYGVDVVIDGRNCLDKHAFAKSDILYHGIGRSL